MAEDSSITFILESIANAGEIKMDFKRLATTAGISRSDHAGTKFQNQLKKHGYRYDRNESSFVKLDGTTAPATPAKKAATNGEKGGGKKGTSTPKKRKLAEAISEDEEGSSGDNEPRDGDEI